MANLYKFNIGFGSNEYGRKRTKGTVTTGAKRAICKTRKGALLMSTKSLNQCENLSLGPALQQLK